MDRSDIIKHLLDRIGSEASAIRAAWAGPHEGTTTRHCAIDNLLPTDVALEIYSAFPRSGEGFLTRKSFREFKRTSSNLDQHPKILADITYALQSPEVISLISGITGMDDLEPDPHLYAGGLSMMFRDEFLNPHIDNSHERDKTKYRRINLLYYVTPDWKQENGGNLEVWNDDVTTPVVIPALFNRLALMETNKTSWHSVSQVVGVDGPRCCVSNYYFSEKSPDGDEYYHVTSFTGRPEQKVRRILGAIDNKAREFARSQLRMSRKSDTGYTGDLADKG